MDILLGSSRRERDGDRTPIGENMKSKLFILSIMVLIALGIYGQIHILQEIKESGFDQGYKEGFAAGYNKSREELKDIRMGASVKGNYTYGKIDNVMIFNKSLTYTEIQLLYKAGLGDGQWHQVNKATNNTSVKLYLDKNLIYSMDDQNNTYGIKRVEQKQ